MAKKKRTARAIQRAAFDKEYSRVYKVSRKVAREARRLFEKHTLEDATKKLLKQHPRIAESKVGPAKAAVTRKEKEKEIGGGGVLPLTVKEYIVHFSYKNNIPRDVIVTATSPARAYETAWTFLRDDPKAKRIAKVTPKSPLSEAKLLELDKTDEIKNSDWTISVAFVKEVNETEGLAEFRDASTNKPEKR